MIKINRLEKFYNKGKANEIHVIDNATIEFPDTGLVCILGESGAGKTTLLNSIGGLDTYQGGSISINDEAIDANSKEIEKLRNAKFGYIFQDQFLLQEYSVAYNIRLALNMYDISDEEKEERIDYVLQAVDMKKYKRRLVSQLSGGQKQRVAIARALVKSPEIIFADEPTGNLDEANTIKIMGIIKKISKECLVILVTHEKRIASFFADRIIYINEGKVVKDIINKSKEAYRINDDTNLYLKEYDKEIFQNNNIKINLYNNGGASEIQLNMVYVEGKLYIQTPSEGEVVFLTSGDEMQLIEDVRPEYETKQLIDFDYCLSPINKSREPKLSWKETLRLANENIKMIGRKQFFLVITFIITAVLLVLTSVDYMTATSIDIKSVITEDSHYVNVVGKRNSSAKTEQYYNSFDQIFDSFQSNELAEDIYIDLDAKLSFTYAGFRQTKELDYSISDFSYVTLDHFKEEDLILGRMPEDRNEIIMDKWLIDVFENSDSVFTTLMPDMNSFLNLKVKADISAQDLVIVGISDVGEPTVFIDKYTGISTASWGDKIASLKQLQKEYPGQYNNIALSSGEVLVSEAVYEKIKLNGEDTFLTKNGDEFAIVGTFPNDFGVSYVIDERYYDEVLTMYIKNSRRFLIYTDDKEEVMDYFNKNLGGYSTIFVRLVASDRYADAMDKYVKDREITIDTRLVVTVTTFILCMLMLYFTMKSNAIKRAQELTVYRLVGITKKSILVAFVVEIVKITSYSILPVVLILSGIISIIADTPSLQTNIVYPWYTALLLLATIYIVNIVIGIIPVYQIVKLPPAQIGEKGYN